MINFRLLRNSDFALWISVLLLVIIGFMAVYSTTFAMVTKKNAVYEKLELNPFMYVQRHFVSFLMGLACLVFFAYMDYGHFKNATFWLYGVMLVLLLAVVVIGYETYGAQRWIGIGFLSIQPSEIAKLITILVLAKYIETRDGIKTLADLVPILAIVGIPFLIIFKQPDLGTALVLIAIMFGMTIFGKADPFILLIMLTPIISALLSFKLVLWLPYLIIFASLLYLFRTNTFDFSVLIGANVIMGLAVPMVWNMFKDYQKERLLTFLNPAADPYGAGYHTIQSQIAIGAGGLWGQGFLHGTQTQLQFIPQQWTDFIFSMIGEEFGLVGALIVILLFSVLIWRAISIAVNARDFYGSLIASGIAAMFMFHVFVNIGMTLGIAPVVGIPLPLISFGGTSMIMNLAAIGILQSISMRREKLFF